MSFKCLKPLKCYSLFKKFNNPLQKKNYWQFFVMKGSLLISTWCLISRNIKALLVEILVGLFQKCSYITFCLSL